MEKTTTALETPLKDHLDRLAAFEPTEWPVLSLYLDMRPDQHGRDNFDSFIRKALPGHIRAFSGDARKSVERDADRIRDYLAAEVRSSSNGLAIFACAAERDFFQALQLDAPIEQHWLSIGSVPHIYPLARLNDQYPRYAALLLDTNAARLFVFGLNTTEKGREVSSDKTRRTMVGGWSQARYQRNVDHFRAQHMKEVVSMLDQVVRNEALGQIIVACDDVTKPLLMEQLPKHLQEKVVDLLSLPVGTPEHEVLGQTLDALRQQDAKTDTEQVEALVGAWRAGGLGVVGADDTLKALTLGQVEEMLITADPGTFEDQTISNELVTKAQQTAARIRFIEDATLLKDVGGVGALLRFRI